MTINEKKNEIRKFNFRTSLDFPPIFTIDGSAPLRIVKKTKLLGIILSSSLKWAPQVDFMCQRALKKVWLLRKLKILELDTELLLDFYLKEISTFFAPFL